MKPLAYMLPLIHSVSFHVRREDTWLVFSLALALCTLTRCQTCKMRRGQMSFSRAIAPKHKDTGAFSIFIPLGCRCDVSSLTLILFLLPFLCHTETVCVCLWCLSSISIWTMGGKWPLQWQKLMRMQWNKQIWAVCWQIDLAFIATIHWFDSCTV